jgi:hypothetical protein
LFKKKNIQKYGFNKKKNKGNLKKKRKKKNTSYGLKESSRLQKVFKSFIKISIYV